MCCIEFMNENSDESIVENLLFSEYSIENIDNYFSNIACLR